MTVPVVGAFLTAAPWLKKRQITVLRVIPTMAFCLTYILVFYLAYNLGIYSGILFVILFGKHSDILSGILFDTYSDSLSGV